MPSEDSLSEHSQEKSKYPKKAPSLLIKNEDLLETDVAVKPSKRINSRRFRRDTKNIAPENTGTNNKVKRSYYQEFVQTPLIQIYHAPYDPRPQFSQRTQYLIPPSPSSYNAQPAYLMYSLMPAAPFANRNPFGNYGNGQKFYPPGNVYLPAETTPRPTNT